MLFGIFSGLSFYWKFFSGFICFSFVRSVFFLFTFFVLCFRFFQFAFFQVIFAGVILFRYFSGFICPYSLQFSLFSGFLFFCFFSFFFQVSLFSGVIFHGCFSGYIFCMIRFDFFRLPGKPLLSCSGFMWCFSVFLLPSSRNEAAACASFADLDGDGNLEALTGCNCLFLVFGG